ncbi:hypothetical protein DL96DRAFT_1598899 [Flagelloscypha sp. PMI_526]|nr:hypothetical protein DL96DRAFT_1598899 [Flagelloscypha sp. PMI_526]
MADLHTSRLCTHLVNLHFGPLTAKLADVLLTKGRLSLSQIISQTKLRPQTARAAILVLIQHDVLWYAKTDDSSPEVLEFNIEGCLMRLRFGKFVFLSEQLLGKPASEIVQLILDHGKLRPPDIITQLPDDQDSTKKNYREALLELVKSHYLLPATETSHITPKDTLLKYEKEEVAKIPNLPTSKALKIAKEDALARVKREEEESRKSGLKKKGGHDMVDDKVLFRVNYERFNIVIRNELIEKAARERFNDGAAMVLRNVIKSTESSQTSLMRIRSDATSVGKVAAALTDYDNLSSGLQLPTRQASNTVSVKHYLQMLGSTDNRTAAGRASSFVSYEGSKIEVEFQIVCRRLRRRVIESFTREKYGQEGVRMLRLLYESGKLDEKQISKIVMLPAKDVRPLLLSMATDSLVSIQEVPKSADRNPTRTFYLWYVDQAKAFSVILGNLYKMLYNIISRRRAESEDPTLRAVIEKTQRTDVSQDESLLTRLDQEILEKWREKQLKLMVLEMRVEETVFVVRDLAVFGIDED